MTAVPVFNIPDEIFQQGLLARNFFNSHTLISSASVSVSVCPGEAGGSEMLCEMIKPTSLSP